MTKGFDANSLRANKGLEIIEKFVKRSTQGAIVAALTGESILGGASIIALDQIWYADFPRRNFHFTIRI